MKTNNNKTTKRELKKQKKDKKNTKKTNRQIKGIASPPKRKSNINIFRFDGEPQKMHEIT